MVRGVESEGTRALACGMQGLEIRLAKAVNRRLGRAGRVFTDRYHCRALRTPREVRNALVYVLLNGRKHAVKGSKIVRLAWFPKRASAARCADLPRAG